MDVVVFPFEVLVWELIIVLEYCECLVFFFFDGGNSMVAQNVVYNKNPDTMFVYFAFTPNPLDQIWFEAYQVYYLRLN